MATNKAKPTIGKDYSAKGQIGTLIAISRGWCELEAEDGSTFKARAKELKAPRVAEDNEGQRVYNYRDPEDGELKRQAIFKMDRYTVHKDVATESGNYPVDIGDDVAGQLRGLSQDDQYALVAKSLRALRDEKWEGTKAEIEDELRNRYSKCKNAGQVRMNLGNVLRGAIRRAERAEEEAA